MIDVFANKKVHKEYLAVVQGKIIQNEMKIENKIGKIHFWEGQTIYGVLPKGKLAITYLNVLKKQITYL